MAKILLIEDEDAIRSLIVNFLKLRGYFVIEADDGKKGVEILKNDTFDIIITDLRTPSMDSFALLTELGKFAKNAQIIVTTGHLSSATLMKSDDIKVSAYLEKPFSANYLLMVIENLLKK